MSLIVRLWYRYGRNHLAMDVMRYNPVTLHGEKVGGDSGV